MSLYVGLDVGTQSVKLLAYDSDARCCAFSASAPLDLLEGANGEREQHAEWWLAAIRTCFAAMPGPLRSRVRAIGVSGQQHGFVPLGAGFEVLAPVKLWNDTSCSEDASRIMQAAGGRAACIALAGNPLATGYTAPKLPWTRRNRPDVYAALRTILLPHDYVDFWLTGECWMEHGDASGTGWLDVRRRDWSPELLAATDPDRDLAACLPPWAHPDASFQLRASVAAELGLPTDVRVAAGGGDNMMAAIGTGNVAPGRLTMSLGTSGTLFAHADRPVVDDDGRWAAFCASDGGWLPLICTMNCTVATERVAALCGIEPAERDMLVESTPAGAAGLTMLPFFSGERTPDLPRARASLHGMSSDNSNRAHLYRAAMEGATYGLRHGYDALCEAGLSFERIRLTGGGSRSPAWRQMVADVFALPVEVPAESEGAAFGAALQALWADARAAGSPASLADVVDEHLRIDADAMAIPDAGRTDAYGAAYRRFSEHLEPLVAMHARAPAAPAGTPHPRHHCTEPT